MTPDNDATRSCAPVAGSVYEIVDCTSEEIFYPLGIYLALDDALAAVMVDSPEQVGCVDHDEWDQSVRMEIRERRIGPSGHGKAVWHVSWNYSFDADDEKLWSRSISPNTTVSQPREPRQSGPADGSANLKGR